LNPFCTLWCWIHSFFVCFVFVSSSTCMPMLSSFVHVPHFCSYFFTLDFFILASSLVITFLHLYFKYLLALLVFIPILHFLFFCFCFKLGSLVSTSPIASMEIQELLESDLPLIKASLQFWDCFVYFVLFIIYIS
jgi:hypothetical protein